MLLLVQQKKQIVLQVMLNRPQVPQAVQQVYLQVLQAVQLLNVLLQVNKKKQQVQPQALLTL